VAEGVWSSAAQRSTSKENPCRLGWLCHQPCFPPPSFVSCPEGTMSQSVPASPPPLHPDWKVNSVALNEGRAAMKRLTPPKCLTGCRGCVLSFLAPSLLPTGWAVLNREACLGTTEAVAFPGLHASGDKDESHTQGKWKNPTSSPCWGLT